MDEKCIKLITRFEKGYYLSDAEIEDLELYLKSKLKEIEFMHELKKYNILR